jgi:uncharacterized protein YbjQ (UPF0145 family)
LAAELLLINNELKNVREFTIGSMEEKTEKNGGNTIRNPIKYKNLGGTMGNTIMVTVTGTAV